MILPGMPMPLAMQVASANVADVFSSDLYTGNGSTQAIINGIDVAGNGGLVWTKRRTTSGDHQLTDTERGAPNQIRSNLTAPEDTGGLVGISSFNSDGFALGSWGGMNSATAYIAWTFRKAKAFFDIVTWTGDDSPNRQITHNLGIEPGLIVVKSRTTSDNWLVWTRSSPAANDRLVFNGTFGFTGSAQPAWGGAGGVFDASVFTVGGPSSLVNASGQTYVAYLFAHDPAGVIQCASYTGNGSTAGPSISLGWEPQYLIIKRTDTAGDWWIYDAALDATNPRTAKLLVNSASQLDPSGEDLDFTPTGFQPKSTDAGINGAGGNYIYLAIRAEGT